LSEKPTRAKATTARFVGPTHPETDPANIIFDWVPAVIDGQVTFRVAITRGERHSSHEFDIDLNRLTSFQQERLHCFLGARHAGVTSAMDVTRATTWLLDIWLCQTQPSLSKLDRDALVKAMLLAEGIPQ
jgi:hypothetical protein